MDAVGWVVRYLSSGAWRGLCPSILSSVSDYCRMVVVVINERICEVVGGGSMDGKCILL